MVSSPLQFRDNPATTITAFFKRNALLIAGVGIFVTFWMLVYTFTVFTPQYAASSTVIIKDSAVTSRYVEPDQYFQAPTTSSSSSNPVLNTMGILKSNAISDALWKYMVQFHPEELTQKKIKTQDDWNNFFQDGSAFIKAKNQPGTDLITIQFAWRNKVIAKEGLEVIIKAFQENSRDLNKAEQVTRTAFLGRQVSDLEQQLNAIRRKKSDYQSRKGTVSIQREQDDLAGSRMELENRLNQLESQAQGQENLSHRYQTMLGLTPKQALDATAVGQNSSMSKLQDELYRLEQVRSLLTSTLTDTNPKVSELQAQIDRVKANISTERARTLGGAISKKEGTIISDTPRSTVVGAMVAASANAQDFRTQANVIRARLNQVTSDIKGYPSVVEGLANLSQQENSLSTALDQLRQKVLEGRIKEDQTLSNVFVVDAARTPEKPKFPTQLHLVVISLILGFGVGVASALLKEQMLNAPVTDRRRNGNASWLAPMDDLHPDDDHNDNDDDDDHFPPLGGGGNGDDRNAIPQREGNRIPIGTGNFRRNKGEDASIKTLLEAINSLSSNKATWDDFYERVHAPEANRPVSRSAQFTAAPQVESVIHPLQAPAPDAFDPSLVADANPVNMQGTPAENLPPLAFPTLSDAHRPMASVPVQTPDYAFPAAQFSTRIRTLAPLSSQMQQLSQSAQRNLEAGITSHTPVRDEQEALAFDFQQGSFSNAGGTVTPAPETTEWPPMETAAKTRKLPAFLSRILGGNSPEEVPAQTAPGNGPEFFFGIGTPNQSGNSGSAPSGNGGYSQ